MKKKILYVLACTWLLTFYSCKPEYVFEYNPTCSDGIQNQDELGVDCGGVCGNCPNQAYIPTQRFYVSFKYQDSIPMLIQSDLDYVQANPAFYEMSGYVATPQGLSGPYASFKFTTGDNQIDEVTDLTANTVHFKSYAFSSNITAAFRFVNINGHSGETNPNNNLPDNNTNAMEIELVQRDTATAPNGKPIVIMSGTFRTKVSALGSFGNMSNITDGVFRIPVITEP